MEKKMIVTLVVAVIAIAAIGGVVYAIMNQSSPKTINSLDDLEGSVIAVQNGTTGDKFAKKTYEDTHKADVKRYNTYPDAILDLKNGKVDAIIMDKAPAQAYVANYSGIKILDAKLDTETESYCFIFNLSNTALKDEFNTALATLKDNGKLAEIEAYWAEHLDGQADPYIPTVGTGTTLTVATSPDFPPYDSMYGTKFTGIDMDIIRAISTCGALNYNISFVNSEFDGVLTGVSTGTYDVGASGISYDSERAAEMLFSDEYTTTEQVVVVRA